MEFDPDWWTPTTDEYDDETAEQDTEIRFTIERGRPGYAFNGEGE